MIRLARIALLLSLAGFQIFALGCAQTEPGGQLKENQAPTVWLSGRPPEGSLAQYRLHMFWGGWDPDGQIAHYEFLITNNLSGVFDPCDTAIVDPCPGYETPVWNKVVGNDSIFQFTADAFVDSTDQSFKDNELKQGGFEFQRSHTFFIRAVDEFGERSKEPTYISFTSRTLSPTINVTIPVQTGLNAALVPPTTTFQWEATDFIGSDVEIQDPDSVRWLLISTTPFGFAGGDEWLNTLTYIRSTPDAPEWSDWVDYGLPDDEGKKWTTPPLDIGPYMFAMQAKDEAGAVTPVFDERFNVRRLLASTRSTGAILTVSNRYLGTLVTANTKTPLVIADLPAGVPMSFEFEATAESYGGVVAGYRYGWDILDLNNDDEWDISYTTFVTPRAITPARTFFFGSHTFHIEVIDNSGEKSRIGVTINIIPFTMEFDLLFIDDVLEPPSNCGWAKTNGGAPCDSERDAFWMDMLSDLQNFNAGTDVIELNVGGVAEVPLRTFAKYKAVIWNASGTHNSESGSGLARVIQWIDPDDPVSGKTSPNIAALYMAAGGKILIVGQEVMTMVVNFGSLTPAYPIIFRYELDGDQELPYSSSDGNIVGVRGVGEDSFAYAECCLNVLDISKIQSPLAVRNPNTTSCPVHLLRDHDIRTDGLREAIPAPVDSFPTLTLRPEAASNSSKFYHESKAGLVNEIYNPRYFFIDVPQCRGVVEFVAAPRGCIAPIYNHGCLNTSSKIYNQMIAFWSLVYENRIPDSGGIAARSAVWGFDPVFFNPSEVQGALDIILYDEWELDRIP